MKQSRVKPRTTVRIEAPLAGKGKDGKPTLLCPFCKPTHPIIPGKVSMCGTALEMRAVQTVFKARFIKGMVCAKCGQGGGDMVHFQNAFVHVHDCTPGVAVLTQPPVFTPFARLVYGLPEKLKTRIEKRTGMAVPVDEVKPDGTRTGQVLGYFFNRS